MPTQSPPASTHWVRKLDKRSKPLRCNVQRIGRRVLFTCGSYVLPVGCVTVWRPRNQRAGSLDPTWSTGATDRRARPTGLTGGSTGGTDWPDLLYSFLAPFSRTGALGAAAKSVQGMNNHTRCMPTEQSHNNHIFLRRARRPKCGAESAQSVTKPCCTCLAPLTCYPTGEPDWPVLSSACFWHGYRCPKPAHEVSDEWVTTPPQKGVTRHSL